MARASLGTAVLLSGFLNPIFAYLSPRLALRRDRVEWTSAERHEQRVRNLILVGGLLCVVISLIWSIVYLQMGDICRFSVTMLTVLAGGFLFVLVLQERMRVAAVFMIHILVVTVTLSSLAEMSPPGIPRSVHMNFLPVATAAFLIFYREGIYLRIVVPLVILLIFLVFQMHLVPPPATQALPLPQIGWLGVWANNITAIGSTCVVIAMMQTNISLRRALENDIRQAIARGEFHLHYQPQMDGTGRMIGAEALLRWRHPVRGNVPPGEFIALSEETGLIIPIGEWVLRSACAQLQAWANNPATQHLTIAVNVSASQFRQPDFVEHVRSILSLSGAPASRLKLELTESALADDVTIVVAKMRALKEIGISWSLDDFGTGYSSLSSLKRLPLDQLKIDQSFVRDLQTDPRNMPIVEAILSLSETLDLSVIAEGVETEAQLAALANAGCRYFQGYYFSRPIPIAELDRLLATQA